MECMRQRHGELGKQSFLMETGQRIRIENCHANRPY